jgi:hypothetical protein
MPLRCGARRGRQLAGAATDELAGAATDEVAQQGGVVGSAQGRLLLLVGELLLHAGVLLYSSAETIAGTGMATPSSTGMATPSSTGLSTYEHRARAWSYRQQRGAAPGGRVAATVR